MNRRTAYSYARMSDSYRTALGRVAYEKSRPKPDDIGARRFGATWVAIIVGFFLRVGGLIGRLFGRKAPQHRTHARGYGTPAGFGSQTTSKIGRPLKTSAVHGFSASASLCSRKERMYATRGYGYIEPVDVQRKRRAAKGYKMVRYASTAEVPA